jgi:phage tail-like protein
MARSSARDPLDKYRWEVQIEGFSKVGFTQSGVPKYSITTREYAEGGAHLNPKSIIDKVSYAPITLSRGVTGDTSFAKWASGAWDLVQNNARFRKAALDDPKSFTDIAEQVITTVMEALATDAIPSSTKYPFSYRRTVTINHVNRTGQTIATYVLFNAYPIAYQPASDFDALADDGLSIETLTLAYEGFEARYNPLVAAGGGLVANAST